jgi:NAD(P)-dependent dehydrogenase (short-subunit alcohol dehydrogenase family)/ketosteroid isomerase-like protein
MTRKANEAQSRVWLVTGASSGFGRALSEAVLARGGPLVATARQPQALQSLVDRYPDRALALRLDVTDAGAAREAMKKAVARFGRIDVVFNNAGYGHVGAVEELGDEDLRRQIDVNLLGVINVTRAALPHLRRQRSGHLVQMSSLNGVEGLAGGAYYAASKFGIEGFSESLAAEVAHLGIRVTIVEPGPFRTRFLDHSSAKWAPPMPDYVASVGKARELLRQLDGTQPGDPRRAAEAIIGAVEAEQPPLRLPLGRMAIDHMRKVLAAGLASLDAAAEAAARADFPAHEDLVRRAYGAFNEREIESGVALMAPDVDWPNVPRGGFVHGQEQVRKHWREQFGQVDPRIEVEEVRETSDGRVEARVRQIVRRLDGSAVSDDALVHVFTIAGERIKRMEVKGAA